MPNIELITPAKPTAFADTQLQLDNGMILSADLVVAADGALSPLRDWAGIRVRGWPYRQKGLVCTVTTEHSHQHTARQHFLSEGPLAFLPLPERHQCSIVWSLNSDNADRMLALPEPDFIAELEQAFESRLGRITSIGKRAAFPLQLRHAECYVKPGLALVGDAAHTIHPLAGQGVNIGLLDATTLADVILEAAGKGRDIGSLHTLQKYQRRRRADNVLMQISMDAFKRTFSSGLAPVRWARRFGLNMVGRSTLLKNLFMRQASVREFARPEQLSHRTRQE
jgi:2-octaprenylphenol hydroxylase